MMITRQLVAEKITAHLQHELPLAHLVAWAECAMVEGNISPEGTMDILDALAQLGLADIPALSLNWQDFEALLQRLGYRAQINIEAAKQCA